jgi:hypothetical protein
MGDYTNWTLRDLADRPMLSDVPTGTHGLNSISKGLVTWHNDTVWCRQHGAMLCVSEDRELWRCPTCREAAWRPYPDGK